MYIFLELFLRVIDYHEDINPLEYHHKELKLTCIFSATFFDNCNIFMISWKPILQYQLN